MQKSVAILGAGVAGMSAAHELSRLGYRVDLYDPRPAPGGKAQSQTIPGTGKGGRLDLPGEHGFRFYPSFYRYLIETMSEIPLDPDRPLGPKVSDNLHACDEAGFGAADGIGFRRMLRRSPKTTLDLVSTLSLFFEDLKVSPADMACFGKKILRYFASSRARRDDEYEKISWWEYVEGDRYEPTFQKYIRAVPRIMVAMDPKNGSARTIGNISMQLIVDYGKEGVTNDRTLMGPTTEKWLRPWKRYLEQQGVAFHLGQGAAGFLLDEQERRITGVRVEGQRDLVTADYYIAAMPLEVAVNLISDEMASFDELSKLRVIRERGYADSSNVVADGEMKMTDWMVGIQYYLREDVPLVRGHVFFPDSPWALSAISQAQFWALSGEGRLRTRYGDGSAGGILSVDISNWNREGNFIKKPAKHCTREEIKTEVWEQLKAGLRGQNGALLADDLLLDHVNLDQEILFPEDRQGMPQNGCPLLVHPPNSWKLRPKAATGIDNLMLASDYVQNETILACMEGANEAARLAVKAIHEREGGAYNRVNMPLTEPAIFDRAKEIDRIAYDHLRGKDDGVAGHPGGPPSAPPGGWDSLWQDDPSRPFDLDDLRRLEAKVTGL